MNNLEQQPPNKPNFLLILILFGATIIAIFVVAYFVLDWDAGGLLPKRHPRHPSSRVVLHTPGKARPSLSALQLPQSVLEQQPDNRCA